MFWVAYLKYHSMANTNMNFIPCWHPTLYLHVYCIYVPGLCWINVRFYVRMSSYFNVRIHNMSLFYVKKTRHSNIKYNIILTWPSNINTTYILC